MKTGLRPPEVPPIPPPGLEMLEQMHQNQGHFGGNRTNNCNPGGGIIRMHNGRVLSDGVFGGALSGRSETSRNI